MRTLTKEAERKLISAIERAASLVNDGMTPNNAIIKSAEDANIPAGHINLMVHAYNTGRTTTTREKGASVTEKTAEFPLADTATIMAALYPTQVKTSAELRRDEIVSTEYAVPPSGFLNRRRDSMQKAASASIALPEKTWTPPPRDEHAAVMRAQSEKNAALRAAEETRRQAAAAYQKAANSLDELNTYFRTPGNMPFGDALREVGLRLGPSGVSVLQKIAAVYPHFAKQADSGKNHYGHDSLYRIVEDVIGTVEHYNEAQSRVATKKADAGFCKKETPEFITGSILHNPADEPLTLKEANLPNLSASSTKLHAARDARRNEEVVRKGVSAGIDELFENSAREQAQAKAQDDADFSDFVARERDYTRTQRNQDLAAKARQEAAQFDADEQAKRDRAAKPPENVLGELFSGAKDPAKKLLSGVGRAGGGLLGATNKAMKDNTIGITTPVKMVGGLIGASQEGVAGQIGKMLHGDEKSDKTKEHFQALNDVDHEQALKTIRAKGVLHDLVINDPVISGHDPQDVAMAFNEIAELAPNLVDSPGLIQSVLRKRLEAGTLADFDVKQILEMDKLRADRDKTLAETRDIRTNRLL
jgi:hypothetical protein